MIRVDEPKIRMYPTELFGHVYTEYSSPGKARDDMAKVFRGLKRIDTPIIPGMKAYYNFAKKHAGINGMTPAEASLIEVDGKNK